MKRLATVLLAGATFCGGAWATTITAVVTGSNTPSTDTHPNTVTNGGFNISGNDAAPLVGNGIDETTRWTWDFTTDGNYGSFNLVGPLTAATMTLTLTVPASNPGIVNDTFWLDSVLPTVFPFGVNVTDPGIQGLSQGTTNNVVVVNLLSYYTSAQILSLLNGGTPGTLTGTLFDDSIVSSAQLALTDDGPPSSTDVPEPSTSLLLGAGLVAVGYLQRRFRNRA